ncbi:low temperature requirement protein A [Fibrella aquatilis]|uniref:Low temperature requirement protein A n=1 Tax=Fibrella aquatilis TaxID=2817059 RepID=A0A939G035_9BACT|nr:low temperature requirement protein A [Fibrella aquatilis]MBO0929494.1 low temperature requirement protein A [Fibrella aquatilis]
MANETRKDSHIPRLRSGELKGQRRTTWAELLNDLVYTAIIAQLANRLLHQLDGLAMGQFFLLYVPVWWLWNGQTHYATRFDSEQDVVHRLLGCLQLVGLLVLAGAIPTAIETNATIYALTYALVRGVLLLEYIRAWHYVPEARPYINVILIGFSISVLIWITSIGLSAPYRYILWAVALIIELATPITSGGKLRDFPPDVRHLPERYGLFTLLVLGQAVTGIVQGLVASPFHAKNIAAACLGGVLIFGLWWAYFDRLDDDAVRKLALEHLEHEQTNKQNRTNAAQPEADRDKQGKPTVRRYTVWLYIHLPLTVALTVLGVALTYTIKSIDQLPPDLLRWLLTGSVGMYLLAEAVISLTTLHAGPSHVSFKRGVIVRLGTGLAVLLLGWLTHLDLLLLLSAVTGIVMTLIISDQFSPDAPDSAERTSEDTQEPTHGF